MSRARLGAAAATAGLLVGAGAVGWAGGPWGSADVDPATSGAEPRLVLVSGRDDHGMVVSDTVPLYDEPEGDREVAEVYDGTLVEVLSTDGQWLQVRTAEGRDAIGWVDDFFLRGEARLVGPAPSCGTTIGEERREGGTIVIVRDVRRSRVLVESVTPPVLRGWAPRADLQELPPQGAGCGDVPPDDRHAHSH